MQIIRSSLYDMLCKKYICKVFEIDPKNMEDVDKPFFHFVNLKYKTQEYILKVGKEHRNIFTDLEKVT